VSEALRAAQSAQAAGRLDEALEHLRAHLARFPDDPSALQLLGVVHYQAGQVAPALTALKRAAALAPGDAVAHSNLGSVLRAVGDAAGAEAAWRRAVELEPRYAEAHNNLATLWQAAGRLDEALAAYERALACDPGLAAARANRDQLLHAGVSDADLRDLFVVSTGRAGLEGDFRGLRARLAARRGERRLLVLAAAPKSASTYFANLLAAATGYPYANLCYTHLQNEHDLYPPALLAWNASGAVSQLHMRGTLPNARLARFFGIRPILLVRNLFDTVVSMADQLGDRDWLAGPDRFSFAVTGPDLADRTPAQRADFVIDLMVPWYVAYFVSWTGLVAAGEVEAMWLDYAEVTGDPAGALARALQFTGVAVAPAQQALAVARLAEVKTRVPKFNRGEAGRGEAALTPAQKARIRAQLAHYPDVDFGPVGVESRGNY